MSIDHSIQQTFRTRPRRAWRQWFLRGLLGVVACAALPAGYYAYRMISAHQILRAAVDEADGTDPGWRLEELEARRTPVADADNAGLVVAAAHRLMPPKRGGEAVFLEIEQLRPPVLLRPRQEAALRQALQPLAPAVREALKLRDREHGRYVVHWTPDYLSTLLPHVQEARAAAALLLHDAALRSQAGDTQRAWVSIRAALNAGRSVGDEPAILSQLVRLGVRSQVVRALERTLAQGQLPGEALADMQAALAREAAEPVVLVGLRGERADLHQLFTNLEAGTVSLSQLDAPGPARTRTLKEWATDFLARDQFMQAHGWMLHHMTQLIEVLKRPAWEQQQPLADLAGAVADAPMLARRLVPAGEKIASAQWRSQAELACATAALAAERYRLGQGRWPEGLASLVQANLLDKLPLDPSDGQPLRFRTTADGVVVYSVGPERNYRGDALDQDTFDAGAPRPEFRLWNVARRRQPPPAEAPAHNGPPD
jgi:hypothetical protein